ncbi:DUF2066 domain-containing protein [Bradyrhizobium jicamae]|uniref:DUF2066 domain-containing protein n=1 Tax=Bradyrhizobium jicamae TaxID=280332 RepID=UPI001BAAC4BB|nr:DUF2066 domain-containing protein [Bradyrhizobium jicamae]MBR0752426.1 DUF2066 domain-containing protein [Bradyrhizobium jicamae]
MARQHRMIGIALAFASLCWIASPARAADNLYRMQTVVTGQLEPNRLIGFAACFEDVLIKISGAQKLAGDKRLMPYKAKARDYVTAFNYHDQFSGKPIRDEQGTRDRPYDLTVDFDEARIGDVLKALDLKPWLAERPVLAVFVEMKQDPRDFIITTDERQSELQRDALRAAGERRGMGVVLPAAADITKAGINAAELTRLPASKLTPVTTGLGGAIPLVGRLTWDDRELGWATQWQIDWQGHTYRWQFRGVTFDEAFRRGIGGAAQVLSGNGDPGGKAR